MVRMRRLELPRTSVHNALNVARLPIPPQPHLINKESRELGGEFNSSLSPSVSQNLSSTNSGRSSHKTVSSFPNQLTWLISAFCRHNNLPRTKNPELGKQDSNLRSRNQNPLPYRLAIPQNNFFTIPLAKNLIELYHNEIEMSIKIFNYKELVESWIA